MAQPLLGFVSMAREPRKLFMLLMMFALSLIGFALFTTTLSKRRVYTRPERL